MVDCAVLGATRGCFLRYPGAVARDRNQHGGRLRFPAPSSGSPQGGGVVETVMEATRLVIRGVVQGVGFRPFVYRIAHRHGVHGWIANSSRGVVVEAEGARGELDAFARAIEEEAPPLARIERVDREAIEPAGSSNFEIRVSRAEADESTLICPDVAICPDCLAEFLDPSDRRHRYPFINCTNCGPRFSIIEGTPYDRPRTSMKSFQMCERCQREYEDPLDRRFHAQPNACPVCGPSLSLVLPSEAQEHTAELILGRSYARMPDGVASLVDEDPAAVARWLLKNGAIIGVRGLGGFHVAANAAIDATVRALRETKNRPAKPFALMCRSLDVARELVEVGEVEEGILTSPWSPIVLLRKRPNPPKPISPWIAPRNRYLGIMLPYAPLHRLLFDDGLEILIMTSANPAGEPIIAEIAEARERLRGITRTFLDHDRGVVNRNDDSIVFVEAGKVAMSRRSRGYAPYPIDLHIETGEVLACGTELKNTFTLLRDGWAFVSQHIGDMENQATLDFFDEMVGKFTEWFRVEPSIVAHDLHPDYLATRYARDYAKKHPGVRLDGVQHHHAHIASVMIENGVSEPVIGLALDGTGYGTDGRIWGCEFLVADLADFERAGHLGYVPLPGGDAAIKHPYRVALSHLHAAGEDALLARGRVLFPDIPEDELELVVQQIEKGVNAIDTSSAGRLFDAVSAMLGICHEISYEAQAAIELESVADEGERGAYPAPVIERDGRLLVDPAPIVRAVLDAVEAGASVETVAGAFHNTVVGFCREVAARLRDERGIRVVALSGGVFQNRLLLRKLVAALRGDGFRVLLHKEVPTNDGGVSLGQAVVANERARRGAL
jgi:hydrogenase maturation protein HypF